MLPAKKAITECPAQGGDRAGPSVAPGASQDRGIVVFRASVSPSVGGGRREVQAGGCLAQREGKGWASQDSRFIF